MAKTVKRIFSGVACLALLFTMLCLSGCDKAYVGSSKQILEKLNIKAQILTNGDMDVVETWRVNLKDRGKAYRKIYKTFSLLENGEASITNCSVHDDDNDINYTNMDDLDPEDADEQENVYYVTKHDNSQEFGLLMPEIQEGVRNFTFRYTVKSQVSSYKDTSVFYYKFISTNFTVPITNMTCSIRVPEGAKKEDLHAWLHCTANSKLTINSGSQITITASEVPVKTNIETRICIPPTLFDSSTVVSSESQLENIKKQEQDWASAWQEKQRNKYIFSLVGAGVGIGLVLFGILLIVHSRKKYKRCKVDVPEYTHDIPEGNSPAGIANLFYYYDGGAERKKGNVFSATFLALARKGYLTFSPNKGNLTVFLTEKYKNGNWVDLTSCEHRFLGLICSVAEAVANEGSNSFTMEQFKAYAKTNYKSVDSTLSDFFVKSNAEISQRGYFNDNPVMKGQFLYPIGSIMIFFSIIVIIIMAAVNSTNSSINPPIYPLYFFIPIGAFICGILLMICYRPKRIKPLNEIGEHDLHVWLGLKKYMLEFSRMKEYSVPQLELWEEYLIYATMMGISKEVCQQLKLVYPEINNQTFRETHWGTSSYLSSMFDSDLGSYGDSLGTDFDFGSVLSNSISDISCEVDRLANPTFNVTTYESSGTSGDGGGCGFDGGGDGFDGGGGGID